MANLRRLLPPRWRKIWADLLISKSRTVLVVMSIVVGIFAVGSIAGTAAIMDREVKALWQDIDPAAATLATTLIDDATIQQVEALPEVSTVQVRRTFDARVPIGNDEYFDISLTAVPSYAGMTLNRIDLESGVWPPSESGILLTNTTPDLVNAGEGDTLMIELPDGTMTSLSVEGIVYDLGQPQQTEAEAAYGYVSVATMEAFSGQSGYNILQFQVAENADDVAYIGQVANSVRDLLESQGSIVFNVFVATPGEPPAYMFIVAFLLVLGVVGSLTFVLSGFLIVNIISALLAQQTKQIGMMKAIGATNGQIMRMYLGLAATFGAIALIIGLPLSLLGASGLARFVGGLSNFQISNFAAPWWVFALQIAIGLIVPILAALIPVLLGTRVSVREALDSDGIDGDNDTLFNRLLARFRGVPRPVTLSFRNTFRRKGRLALTLITLMLAGAIFATVFTVRNSLFNTLGNALDYDNYDVRLDFNAAYDANLLTETAVGVEDVVSVEAWTQATGRYIFADGSESDDITLNGIPDGASTIVPILLDGRWVQAGDSNAVVVNDNITRIAPEIGVGSEISLIVRGQEMTWQVVGIAQAVFSFENIIWTDYAALSERIGEAGLARSLRLTTTSGDAETQEAVVTEATNRLSNAGLFVSATETTTAIEDLFEFRFNTLFVSLLALAVLLAVVGGLGIAGMTGINVLERMREIGVMRSVGAANYQILGIFIVEAVFVGLIGWILGSGMALPISRALSDGVGNAFSNAPLAYRFDITGALLWLVLSIVLAFLSSYLPARRASRITLREVLNYDG